METEGNFLSVLNADISRTSVTLGLLIVFLALLYWYSVYPFSVLSRCGIKHPKPVPFFGNLFMLRQGYLKPLTDLVKTHGKVSGYYFGRKPVVVIADPDMLKQVMIKDFSNFTNRMSRVTTKPWEDCLLMLRDEDWKRVRNILTPTFSAAKMKEMVPLINTATDALMNNLTVHADSGEAFDIHKCFGYFTMDGIASVAFGTYIDSQKTPNHPFVRYAQMFSGMPLFRPNVLFSILFPTIMYPLASLIPNKKRETIDSFFISSIKKIIKQKEDQPPDQRRRDFLQLMLDARTRAESISLEQFETENHSHEFNGRSQQECPSASEQDNNHSQSEESLMTQPQQKMITDDEIVGQAFVFLLAGYDTVSNTLAFTCYLLALHPECQSKVQEEVDDFFTRHGSPDYTNIQELKYLDMVVCEALRIYSPVFKYTREVEHDCVINGHFLPKGIILEIFSGFLHHDPEYWPEPEKFIPERFTPEAKAGRHPFVYLPFGAGPRNCVGMRFAQLEIRMTLVYLFHRFSIAACSETQVPLDLKSVESQTPKNGIYVKITRRNREEELKGSPSDD